MTRVMEPTIICSSKDSLHDSAVHIKVQGLNPKQRVTFHGITTIDNGNKFESLAHYVADENGHIDLDRDASAGGSYIGIEPMGLFWAMKPSPVNQLQYARLMKIHVTTPLVVVLSLYDGFVENIDKIYLLKEAYLPVTRISLNRWMMAPNVQRIEMNYEKDGIYGALFVPSGEGPFPGVITLFGSYAGTLEYKASLLASHGFAALAVAYMGLPGLPPMGAFVSLDLEYFEKTTEILLDHPKVDKNVGIGVIGLSFASFIVLAMGAMLPCIKCVIWLNGFTHPTFGQISYKGKTFNEQPIIDKELAFDPFGTSLIFHGRRLVPTHDKPFCEELAASRIPFYERHDVGYMFVAGLSDKDVTSEYHLNQAEKMLKASKHPNYKLLRYPGAGHLIEPCYGIHHAITPQKDLGVLMDWGGKMVPHCKAQEDSWPKQIEFLKSNLTQKCHSKL